MQTETWFIGRDKFPKTQAVRRLANKTLAKEISSFFVMFNMISR